MPLVSSPTRRLFLKSAAGFAALRFANAANARQSRWALLSDTHIAADPASGARGFQPYEQLKKIAAQVVESAPDGAIISGDLARTEGLPGDYQTLKIVTAPIAEKTPLVLALGNHDHRANLVAAYPDMRGAARQKIAAKYVLVADAGPVRIVTLDSLLSPNVTPGYLGKAQRGWLENYLRAADNTPVLLFVHHTLNDEDGSLHDYDRLLSIAAAAPQVKAIFYGHSHDYHYGEHKGVHLINIPSTAYHFREREPVGWVSAVFTAQGAEFKLHAVAGNLEQNGKTRSVSWR